MNEKIKELAKNHLIQSEYTESGSQICYRYEFEPDELQKFVELIVRESCAIVHKETDESIRIVMAIETHFSID